MYITTIVIGIVAVALALWSISALIARRRHPEPMHPLFSPLVDNPEDEPSVRAWVCCFSLPTSARHTMTYTQILIFVVSLVLTANEAYYTNGLF